uniref:Uncharacterized protein n=1 Tax=Chenopodium quinoa TaxID=63459 RepID=A0A803N039_CHEQI
MIIDQVNDQFKAIEVHQKAPPAKPVEVDSYGNWMLVKKPGRKRSPRVEKMGPNQAKDAQEQIKGKDHNLPNHQAKSAAGIVGTSTSFEILAGRGEVANILLEDSMTNDIIQGAINLGTEDSIKDFNLSSHSREEKKIRVKYLRRPQHRLPKKPIEKLQ